MFPINVEWLEQWTEHGFEYCLSWNTHDRDRAVANAWEDHERRYGYVKLMTGVFVGGYCIGDHDGIFRQMDPNVLHRVGQT